MNRWFVGLILVGTFVAGARRRRIAATAQPVPTDVADGIGESPMSTMHP